MSPLFCLWCGKPLTGKQRKFCSEAHRKRYDRNADKNVRETSAIVRVSSGNDRIIEYKLSIVVRFVGDAPAGEWDWGMVNRRTRREVADMIAGLLAKRYPDWRISVTVQADRTK